MKNISSYVAIILLPLIAAYFAWELFAYSNMPVIVAIIITGTILLHEIKHKKD